ncbi:MAG: recombination protein RecR [Desulfatitalea sp.]|nr:recombination mediator RecR [Desulfatitalea sp.]NNK00336.1 recombination protein RecR [Desulfatitalea sp.]
MEHYPKSIQELIRNLAKLPGVGEKTAERLAMHILRRPVKEAEMLADSIRMVKQKVQLCQQCFGLSDGPQCHVCMNSGRDSSVVCVVEQPADMIAIEKSGAFSGLYHILGGTLAPMEGVGPEDLRIRELFERIERDGVQELILATGTSVEGESTAAYLVRELSARPVRLTRIASGVPVGGDLKYVDKMTLKCALDGRHAL